MTTAWQSPDGHNYIDSSSASLSGPLKSLNFSVPEDIVRNASEVLRQLKSIMLTLCSDQCKDEDCENCRLDRRKEVSELPSQSSPPDEAESTCPDLLENLPVNESSTNVQDKVVLGKRKETRCQDMFLLTNKGNDSSEMDISSSDEQNDGTLLQQKSRTIQDMSINVAPDASDLFSLIKEPVELKGEEEFCRTDLRKKEIMRKGFNSRQRVVICEKDRLIVEENVSREDMEYTEPCRYLALNNCDYSQPSTAFSDDSGISESDLEDSASFIKLYEGDLIEDRGLTNMQDTSLVSETENMKLKENILVDKTQAQNAVARQKVGREINHEGENKVYKVLGYQWEKLEQSAQIVRKMENKISVLSTKLLESHNREKKLIEVFEDKQGLILRLKSDYQTLNEQNGKMLQHSLLTDMHKKIVINKVTQLESIIKQLEESRERVFTDNVSEEMEAEDLRRKLSVLMEERKRFGEATQRLHIDFDKVVFQFKVLQKQLNDKSEQLTKTEEEKVRLQNKMSLTQEAMCTQERIENALKSSLSKLMNFKILINGQRETKDQIVIPVNTTMQGKTGTLELSIPANTHIQRDPSAVLGASLAELRQEIGNLRNNVKERNEQLECTAESWRKFKKRTDELRSICENLKIEK